MVHDKIISTILLGVGNTKESEETQKKQRKHREAEETQKKQRKYREASRNNKSSKGDTKEVWQN